MTPRPSAALTELAAQHADLRARIARCETLAAALDAATIEPDVLIAEVSALRRALDVHNQYEEKLLHPLLIDADWSGAVRVARMVEDHVEEHLALRRDLAGDTTAALRDVLASLRSHLASEERAFLSRRVLRDELVR